MMFTLTAEQLVGWLILTVLFIGVCFVLVIVTDWEVLAIVGVLVLVAFGLGSLISYAVDLIQGTN